MPTKLPLTDDRLLELCDTFGTPLQLYSEEHISKNAQNLLSDFRKYFPDFQQFFAVKALPNPAILQLLVNQGFGLDCCSITEVQAALKLQVPPEKIMFTSNYTSKEDLLEAHREGVIINLDDIGLLDVFGEENLNFPDLISFRFNPDLSDANTSGPSFTLSGAASKFGVPRDGIVEAYQRAKQRGASRFGIHMMTGSGVLDECYWENTVSVLLNTMETIREQVGIRFEFMDIGGGLGIPYKPDENCIDLPSVARKIRKLIDDHVNQHHWENIPTLIMENGRYVTGPYGWLVGRCQAVKRNVNGVYYGLDACSAHLLRAAMYGAYHHIEVVKSKKQSGTENIVLEEANVVGTMCENNDWFAKNRLLPRSKVGDLFLIFDTGAHSHCMGYNYNGKLRAPEVLLRANGTASLIRKRETFDDLYKNCVMPAALSNTE